MERIALCKWTCHIDTIENRQSSNTFKSATKLIKILTLIPSIRIYAFIRDKLILQSTYIDA